MPHIGGIKANLQRPYREGERDCFQQLRQVVQEITNERPSTRYEILRRATETLRQLDREHRSLSAEHAAVLNSARLADSSTFYPAVSQFPAESWLANHGIQTIPMLPHVLSSEPSNDIACSTHDGQNMDAVHNYYILPTNHFANSQSSDVY
ncbi:uncharacterized protein BJ212DRAFT_1351506 [Suillus subaureus]|uniref:BHLH domain-containing protein n=1 Tax=Suillus subaureus TaxID=48587 RepID=A0A9P7EBY5_9AGAM|nr:uncharacterized protein BJ212DRAFT_1351506 [Suillus subaureus]KAG1817201.1 hypothetical protein BJ212DRAFT_1351506 [Suillus subaureus]